MEERRKLFVPAIFVPVLLGTIGMVYVSRNPRFEMFRAVDVLQLVASGMCYGVALMALIMSFRKSRVN